jgi:hypothetical protein
MLYNWLLQQDRFTYSTPLDECKKDIKLIATYIYEKDIGFTNPEKEIMVTYSEMLTILKAKNMNDKLLAYSLLIHSKRYANKSGIFYMTYKQMSEVTGLNESTARRNINKLIELEIIEIVERNVNAGKGNRNFKKPNKYRFIGSQNNDDYYITYNNDFINSCNSIDTLFTSGILSLFKENQNELKLLLPKGQYYTYKNIMDNSTSYY